MSEDQGVDHFLTRVRLFLEEGRYDAALAELEKISPVTPEQQQEKDYLFGWYYMQRKRWQEAEQHLLPLARVDAQKDECRGQESDTTRARRARYLLLLGKVAVNLNCFEDASRHFRRCLKLFQNGHLDLRRVHIQAYYGLGMTCIMNGLFSEAVRHYQEVLDLCQDDEDCEELPDIYYGLCDAYRQLGKFDLAYDVGSKALYLYQRRSDRIKEGQLRTLLGRICYHQGQVREASDHYTEALSIGTIYERPILIMTSFTGLADVRLAEGRFDDARRYCEHAQKVLERVQDSLIIGMMYLMIGKVAQEEAAQSEGEHRQELFEEAAGWFEKANHSFSSIQAPTMQSEVQGRWGQVLEGLGRHQEAMNHWRLAYQALAERIV